MMEELVDREALPQEAELRLKKALEMRKNGIEPWPSPREISATCAQIVAEFQDGVEVSYIIAGRVMMVREHGKTIFVTLQDGSGRVQLYINANVLGDDSFTQFKNLIDIGDIIWSAGSSFRTKMGEISLKITAFSLLSKCINPLPDKFHGIADVEIKYRQRYLDLIMDQDARDRFKKRSILVQEMRAFLVNEGFLEVETPMLHPIPGGALARPFITHHNALGVDLYLRIAPELYLKRLVVGGFERVFEINRNFRNEGISTRHNPEFTMIELYAAYQDYEYAMDLVETMIRSLAKSVCGTTKITYGSYELDFGQPFMRAKMIDAVALHANCAVHDLFEDTIDTIVQKHALKIAPDQNSWGHKLYALFEHLVEPNLSTPTFITDFPTVVSPLAKRNEDNPDITDRFELFIAGMELSNGFNELNDPIDQAKRFREQARSRSSGDVEAHHFDADYITALEYALPPTVGIGIGVDRLAMLLTNAPSIRDVILFPTLKPRQK